MRAHPVTQVLRAIWLALPFVIGPSIGDSLADRSRAVQLTATAGAWVVWALVMVATLAVIPLALTALRLLAPAAPVAVALAALTGDAVTALLAVGGALAALVAVLSCTGWVADDFVDGASYGDERRYSLRAPAALLLGPIPLASALTITSLATGPLLLSARQWLWGGIATSAGAAIVAMAARSMHSLSTRAIVFVPAGATLVDPLMLVDALPMPRVNLTSIAAADVDTTATDLTGGALGLALQFSFQTPIDITRRTGRRAGEDTSVDAILCTPARPAAVLREAAHRAMPPPITRSPS